MTKVKEHEKLDKVNMLKVIDLLEQEKPVTKKVACEMLNITYNTPRLKKLIEEFKSREAGIKATRAALKGTKLSTSEIYTIITEYLDGTAITMISDITFRPTSLINKTVREFNVPLRTSDASYFKPCLIEEEAISEDYEYDDLVYAARYQCPAIIEKKQSSKEGPVYIIYLLGKEQCYASQPYYELADLRKIQKELKINIKPMTGMPPSYNP